VPCRRQNAGDQARKPFRARRAATADSSQWHTAGIRPSAPHSGLLVLSPHMRWERVSGDGPTRASGRVPGSGRADIGRLRGELDAFEAARSEVPV
jgi:hypothetical protein